MNLSSLAGGVQNPFAGNTTNNKPSVSAAEGARVDAQPHSPTPVDEPEKIVSTFTSPQLAQRLESGIAFQQQNANSPLGYDSPTGNEQRAINAYQTMQQQPERQQIDSMLGIDLFA